MGGRLGVLALVFAYPADSEHGCIYGFDGADGFAGGFPSCPFPVTRDSCDVS